MRSGAIESGLVCSCGFRPLKDRDEAAQSQVFLTDRGIFRVDIQKNNGICNRLYIFMTNQLTDFTSDKLVWSFVPRRTARTDARL